MIWRFPEQTTDCQQVGKSPLSLLVAESHFPGAKELLRSERVGYYDSGGNLFTGARRISLHRQAPPEDPCEVGCALFSGRRAQVFHALLVQHQGLVRRHGTGATGDGVAGHRFGADRT